MALQSHPLDSSEILQFIVAGRATFTIKNIETQEHRTFKVKTPPNQDEETATRLFVYMLTGPNNEKDYTYIGHLTVENGFIQFVYKTNYKVALHSTSVKMLNQLFIILQSGLDLIKYEVWHEGRCCRCGRTLTHPESLKNGIGPECAMIKANFLMEKLLAI